MGVEVLNPPFFEFLHFIALPDLPTPVTFFFTYAQGTVGGIELHVMRMLYMIPVFVPDANAPVCIWDGILN